MIILRIPDEKDAAGRKYMGVDMREPCYVEGLDETARVNQLFFWYVDIRYGDAGYLIEDDMETVKELLGEYARHGIKLRLVELAPTAEALEIGRFIGYDIAFRARDSLLVEGFRLEDVKPEERSEGPYHPLTSVMMRYFQPRLNEYGLFNDRETAVLLHKACLSLQRCWPDFFEPYLDEYEVIAVGVIEM